MTKPLSIHGTCVDIKENGVLICGKPGMGKSSLALQLIDRGAILIADDQTILNREEDEVMARCPALKGFLEVRGIGLCSFPFLEKTCLKLCVEICEKENLERLPTPLFVEYYKKKVSFLKIARNDPLGAIKIELKLFNKPEQESNE